MSSTKIDLEQEKKLALECIAKVLAAEAPLWAALAEQAKAINAMIAKVDDGTAFIGEHLLDMKRKVENLKKRTIDATAPTWAQWCAANIKKDFKEINRLVRMAESPEYRDKRRDQVRAAVARSKKKSGGLVIHREPASRPIRADAPVKQKADDYEADLAAAIREFRSAGGHLQDAIGLVRDVFAENEIAPKGGSNAR
jgi:hypothetical protein